MRWIQWFNHDDFLSREEKERIFVKGFINNLEINKELLNIGSRSNYLGSTCLSWEVIFRNKNFSFSSFKSREKGKKVTLVALDGLASLKGQVLNDIFKFKESEKIGMTTQLTLGKKEY